MATLSLDRQKQIQRVVDDIRIKTDFLYPEKSIVYLAQELGVSVFEVEFEDHPEVNAMLVYSDEKNSNRPSIYLKKSISDNRKRFTLAHELGHFVLHKKDNIKFRLDGFDYANDNEYALEETEANYFAASILVPEDILKRLLYLFEGNTEVVADYLGVSESVIKNRIQWLTVNPLA